jgi:hypothetical protein
VPDPLVPPPAGIAGWAQCVAGTLRRSGGPLLVILLATTLVAAVVRVLLTMALTASWRPDAVVWFLLISDLSTVGALFVAAIGWGTGIAFVTQQAAGAPARVTDALAVGWRRCPAMFGWALVLFAPVMVAGTLSYQVASSLLVVLLPVGLYWGLAGSLYSFALIYEPRRVAMVRSVGLVHQAFGAALARGLPALLLYLGGLLVNGWVTAWVWERAEPASRSAFDLASVWLGTPTVTVLVQVPLYLLMLVSLLHTYTQLRARFEPLTTEQLRAATGPELALGT